ncbi:hypothetical protein M422DRAFT_263554 [Sphaerobolus stellatus SS14]|uniref:Uncharacterized protein n=1 Tax=Sphaerobolus stellatus (strain SS14) TaxID=990650 RepID=A0A0C9VAX8_SPHS4|nr:hypothetical protein M422DRAFT_263554 [Sphaerobolus stellatus SS14]
MDYLHHYVNRFVDRDMFMRYLGGGIGHTIHFDPTAGEPGVVWKDNLPDASALLDDAYLAKLRQQARQAAEAPDPELGAEPLVDGSEEVEEEDEDEGDDISLAESDEEPEEGWDEGYTSP